MHQRVELAQQLLYQLHWNRVGGALHEPLLYVGFTLNEAFVLFLELSAGFHPLCPICTA